MFPRAHPRPCGSATPPGQASPSSGLVAPRRAGGLFFGVLLLSAACSRKSDRHEMTPSVASAGLAPSAAAASNDTSSAMPRAWGSARTSDPTVLLTLPIPAYHASVYIDGDETYLLTSSAAYRVRSNEKPSVFRLDLGEGAVMTAAAFVFWSKGAVWQAPKSGGPSQRLGTVPHRPQYFVSDGRDFSWVDKSDEGRFTIQRLESQKPRVVYTAVGSIDTAVMLNAWVFFVERSADGAWRFGGKSLSVGTPAFTSEKKGRTPAMLVASSDLYYYDGNSLEVRQVSPDLQHEETIVNKMICSPIAVAESLFCGQVEGLFEVARRPKSLPRKLHDARNAITAIAASQDRVVWVSDIGQSQLAVNSLSLN